MTKEIFEHLSFILLKRTREKLFEVPLVSVGHKGKSILSRLNSPALILTLTRFWGRGVPLFAKNGRFWGFQLHRLLVEKDTEIMKEDGAELPPLLRGTFPVPRGCLEKGGRGVKEVCGLGNYLAFCLDVSHMHPHPHKRPSPSPLPHRDWDWLQPWVGVQQQSSRTLLEWDRQR